MKSRFFISSILALALGFASLSADEFINGDALIGQKAPDLQARDWQRTEGHSWTMANLRGKYAVIGFTAIECCSVTSRINALKEIYNKYHGKGIQFITLYPEGGSAAKLDETFDIPWITAVDKKDTTRQSLMQRLPQGGFVTGAPRFYVVDPQGKIVKAYIDVSELEAVLEKVALDTK
ncbi:MAG: redoxin domain-containing protein [Fimbriimonadia bacterium]|nr:redoxin domain-containing protein [Fimbriimonadia bacterium]